METTRHQADPLGVQSKTWSDLLNSFHRTYDGGHAADATRDAFHQGMSTVFTCLEKEFPSMAMCEAAPDLVEALELARSVLGNLNGEVSYEVWKSLYEPNKAIRAAIARARGEQ